MVLKLRNGPAGSSRITSRRTATVSVTGSTARAASIGAELMSLQVVARQTTIKPDDDPDFFNVANTLNADHGACGIRAQSTAMEGARGRLPLSVDGLLPRFSRLGCRF